jgi:hypothetical protein
MLTPVTPKLAGAVAISAAISVAAGIGLDGRQAYRLGLPAADPVLIDFLATDSAGHPVLDLKPAEIVLKIDGRVRPVVSLQLVDFTQSSGSGLAASGEAVPPPFGQQRDEPRALGRHPDRR